MMQAKNQAFDLIRRPRRLRRNFAIRRLVKEHNLRAADFILPIFVKEGLAKPNPISSMPGVMQHSLDSMLEIAQQARDSNLGAVMLFGIPEIKDATGSKALAADGILNRAIELLKTQLGDDLVVMADLCLDEFTDHGHCGVLTDSGEIDNDETLKLYGQMALAQAAAGVDFVGTSGMMDGQVGSVRKVLDEAGYENVGIYAYGAKYASAFYGPFRDAVESSLTTDRFTYQQDPANAKEGILEALLDVDEGADLVMVKPGLAYLDVLKELVEVCPIPVGAYQVSGEYSMIEAAAQNGWLDRERTILESLLAFKRAGASNVLTYYALEAAQLLASDDPKFRQFN